jgi:aminoglycoside phosphotransferase (APT) family kinase protein
MFLCDIRSGAGEVESLAVRLAPSGDGAFPTYDLDAQAVAQRVAAAHGVPAPTPVEFVPDNRWVGAPFLVMPVVSGHVPGAVPLHDKWIVDAPPAVQRHMYERFIDQLAAIHRIPVHAVPDSIPRRDVDAELGYWRQYLQWYADGERIVPALDDALRWCSDHRPHDEGPAVLLWGDVRLGNVIFDDHEREPTAVLDWEMATVGAAGHDLAWWRSLEAIQDEFFGRRVAGFPDPDEALARYETQARRRVHDLAWFEVFAMVRSTAVMTRLAVLNERAGRAGLFAVTENPILPLIQRRIDAAG